MLSNINLFFCHLWVYSNLRIYEPIKVFTTSEFNSRLCNYAPPWDVWGLGGGWVSTPPLTLPIHVGCVNLFGFSPLCVCPQRYIVSYAPPWVVWGLGGGWVSTPLLPIRLVPACRAVLSGLMECSITLVSESIVSTVRGVGICWAGDLFQVSSEKEDRGPFQVFFHEEGGPFCKQEGEWGPFESLEIRWKFGLSKWRYHA